MQGQRIWLRYSDLHDRGIIRNRTTLSRWIKGLGFPSGYLIGANTRLWPEDEVEAWLKERVLMKEEAA